MYQAKSAVKNFPLLRPGTLPPKNLRPGTPQNVNRQTPVKTVPSHHTTYAGGNKAISLLSKFLKLVFLSVAYPSLCLEIRKSLKLPLVSTHVIFIMFTIQNSVLK